MAYAETAAGYAGMVVSGVIPACKWVRLACQRHLDDLAKSADPDYPYRFDEAEAARVCQFIELLPHVKGRWAARRETLTLQPWQVFIVAGLFGWRRKRDGLRRFRHAYLAIPRKNGKSALAAGIGLYMWAADGEFGAEVYCGATTEKQAWEVFGAARNMAKRSPDLLEAVGGEVWAKILITPSDSSKFEPLIGDPGDGASPSCAIADEFHEHQTSALVDTMVTGMGAREHPLLLEITTSGFDLTSPCYDQEADAKKVLSGALLNEELFTIIYTIDDEDDWKDPASLVKANPNYDVSVSGEFLETQLRLATQNPIAQNKFKTKHLNVWCSAREAWVNLVEWKECEDTSLRREDFAGSARSVVAFDMASKLDLCAETEMYTRIIDGRTHYYWFSRYWLPEDTVEDGGKNTAIYRKWASLGLLDVTDGASVDFAAIGLDIATDVARSEARELVFDPFNAISVAQSVAAHPDVPAQLPLVEFLQKPWNFSLAMDEITSAIKEGRMHHDGHPITTWCMSNVVARPGKKGMFSPAKETAEAKIDGAVSGIMAVSRLMPMGNEDAGSMEGWINS